MIIAQRLTVLATACLLVGAVRGARAQGTSLTIYGDGGVLVRRSSPAGVPRGASTLSVDPGTPVLDPSTVFLLDDGVELRGSRFSQATGADAALRRSVGRDIDFWVQLRDTSYFVRGHMLSLQPTAVRIAGRVMYTLPGQPAFPDSLVQLQSGLDLTVVASRPMPHLRYAYQTQGLSWRASYNVVVPRVGGGPAAVSGLATIDNTGLTMQDAEVQLTAGTIRRATPRPRPMAGPQLMAGRVQAMAVTVLDEVAVGEDVAETRLYELQGRLDLEPGTQTSGALFAPTSAEVAREFAFEPTNRSMDQWPARADSNVHPDVTYRLRRSAGSTFGDLALPGGTMRVFAPDSSGRPQLLGEQTIGHTPRGQDVSVTTGTAFEISADRTQTVYERRGDRDVVVGYRVAIHNGKDESATVVVRETFRGRWEILDSTVPGERASSAEVRFPMPIAANGDAVLEYRIRIRW